MTTIKKTGHLTLMPIPSAPSPSGSRPALMAFPVPEGDVGSRRVEFTLPPGSTWRPGPYFHQSHDEVLEVLEGSLAVSLNGKRAVLRRHGSMRIEKGVVVDWSRDDSTGESEMCRVALRWEPEDSRMELYWRTYVSLLLLTVPTASPALDKAGSPSTATAFQSPSRFSLPLLRLALQADQYPSPTASVLLSPLTLVLVGLVWLWDMLTAQGWSEEDQMGRGVLRRDWVPREVWEECIDGKKRR